MFSFVDRLILVSPAIVKNGLAFGTPYSEEYPLVTYFAMSFNNPERYITRPSPRYWLLWPGVLIMLLYSFADIFMTLIPILKNAKFSSFNPVALYRNRNKPLNPDDEDQTPMEDRIPFPWWTSGLLASTVLSIALLATKYSMNVGEAILALVLGFIFSFIGVQSSGHTDVNPVGTVAKASQLVFGGISKGAGTPQDPARMLNLAAGVIAAGAASQASDMTGDLKTGYLLRAKPKNQFIAQVVGSVVAVFLASGLFILFVKASPCIMYAFFLQNSLILG